MSKAINLASLAPNSVNLNTLAANTTNLTALATNVFPQLTGFTVTAASNALTITFTPGLMNFRSSTLSNGLISTVIQNTPITLVVPSSATLGSTSAIQGQYIILAINNGGTIQLGISNISGGVNLDESTLISTTAISSSATSASVIYSTAAITSMPFRVIGYFTVTEAVAGTWATGPTLVQGVGGQALENLQTLGVGQTWQNMTGSRAVGTVYYNITPKPILVKISSLNSNISNATLYINGSYADYGSFVTGSWDGSIQVSGIVPPGQSYELILSSNIAVQYWLELRQ